MKKFLSLVLALVMTMSLVTVSAGAKDFTDSSKINYAEAVDVLSEAKVIDGYADGAFNPSNTLTRGAAAKIICNLILGPTTASALVADAAPYKDVPTNHTFAGYIAYCQKEGIISGYADGTFKPAAPLTGYAFMKMLLGALGYDSSKEGYTGPNWSINVAKQAIAIGLDDGNDKFVGQNSVNREEAMLYAFNAMQATMVEYGNDTTITVGDVVVSQSGKASEMVNNASNETIKNDDKMQFAEKYFSDLKLSANGADAFNRPANVWKVKAEEVGTYAKVADATYPESGKISDIYKDLGLGKTIVKADVSVYEDGASSTAVAISKSDDTKLGGNGVLTQVYYNTDKETVTITMVNTYVGTVNRTVAASGNQNRHLEITTEAERPTGASGTEKFDTLEEFKDDAYVLYTFSIPEDAVQSVKTAEAIQGTLTKVVNGKSLDIDSSTYKLSNKYVAESLDVDSSYAVYLDEYGYAIYVEEQEFVSGDYALFVEAQDKSNFSSNRALLVFTDGTYKVVDTAKNYANGTSKIEKNSIVTYKVDDNKEYTLKAVATTKKVENSQTFSMTNGTSKITLKDSDVVYSNSNTVFVVETGDDEYETYVGTNNAPGIKASTGSKEQVTAYYYCKTGSIVTVAWARPIFKYGVAVCAAFSLGQLIYFLVFGLNLHNGQYSLPGTIACMLFTGLLGYFAAEMLLHKSFRVWRTGRVGALVFSAVLVCFGVAMSLDLTGYEGYTPDAEEVEFVSVYLSSNGDYLSCKLDEPESIERTLAAHRAMIADKARQLSYARTTYETPADAPVDSYLYFTVTYALTDGRVVRRSYGDCRAFSRELNEPGSVAQTMTALLNCPEAALDRVLGELADDKSNAYLTGGYYDVVSDGAYGEDDGELTSAQANTLVSALRRDYEAGHASNASLFEDTLYSGSFYVELELWYSVRVDEKPTRQPIDTTSSSSGSVCAIVTPEMTCTLEALAGMCIETPATARGF